MLLREQEFDIPVALGQVGLINRFGAAAAEQTPGGARPLRFAVTATDDGRCRCELGIISPEGGECVPSLPDLFDFRGRVLDDQTSFNAVMIVPTGIGSTLGGHAGDATPAAQLLAREWFPASE